MSLLLERWSLARDGEGQVVLLSGEAGIGKSRICQTLRERLADERHATVLLQCSPYHRSSALYPVLQYFERTTGIAPGDPPELRGQKLERLMGPEMGLSPQSHGHMLRLLGAPDGGRLPPARRTRQQEKAQTLQAPIDLLRALARQLPVLLLIEDAHWIDPTTERAGRPGDRAVARRPAARAVTCRPEYAPPWGNPANLTRLALNRLGQRQCAELVAAVAGGRAAAGRGAGRDHRQDRRHSALRRGADQDRPAVGPARRDAAAATACAGRCRRWRSRRPCRTR